MKFEKVSYYYRNGKFEEPRAAGRVYAVLLALVVFFLVLMPLLLYQRVPVLQSSMMPTFAAAGDSAGLLLNAGFKRGDVVIFERREGGTTKRLIKRVIACPGDRIRLAERTFPDGTVRECVLLETDTVEGGRAQFWLDEPYLHTDGDTAAAYPAGAYTSRLRAAWYTVPEGEYFVAGDHRQVSVDSFSFGPVARSAIQGRVICVYRWTGAKFLWFLWQRPEGLGESLGYTPVGNSI